MYPLFHSVPQAAEPVIDPQQLACQTPQYQAHQQQQTAAVAGAAVGISAAPL